MLGLINITPGSQVIPGFFIGWYGVAYVVGLAVLLLVSQREAERRGFAPSHVWNAFLVVAVFALIGGRLYHVIDQWGPIYSQDPLKAILPPYAGLGLYGGIAGAMLGILLYVKWQKLPFRLALDVVVPGTLFAQGIARWGNFFNQELYGPPSNSPWAIAIDCAHRVAPWFCPGDPNLLAGQVGVPLTTGFEPLFFYEASLDIIGGLIALYLSRRYLARLRPGDLGAFWFIWYGSIRTALETYRFDWDWKLLGVAPTAMVIGVIIVLFGIGWLIYNHRPGTQPYPYKEYVPPPDSKLATEPSFDPLPDDDGEDSA